jgi:hypothetical protein
MQTHHNISLNILLKFNQVVDIVKQLSPQDKNKLIKVLESEQEIDIPEKHKDIVRQRISASDVDPTRLLNWDEVKQRIIL